MKVFLTSAIAFVVILAIFVTVQLFDITFPDNLATVFQSQNKALASCVKTFSDEPLKSFTLTRVDFNGDGEDDTLLQFTSDEKCGTAGCIHEICVSKNASLQEHIPFGYAAKSIAVDDTMTNGMKDLIVNKDLNLKLSWDGSTYTLNTDNSF